MDTFGVMAIEIVVFFILLVGAIAESSRNRS